MTRYKPILVVAIMILSILACSLFQSPTVEPAIEAPTATLTGTSIPNPTNTSMVEVTSTETTLPTNTNVPTEIPTITPTEIPCNRARFVSDVSIPDGTEFSPNKNFTKTWRLKNTGSCSWTSGYDIVFINGDAMNGSTAVQITTGTVIPGAEVDVSVNLQAPAAAGTYRGNWKLRDGSNAVFGVQNSDIGIFWVEIKVKANPSTSIPDWPTIKKGDTGADVYAIQYLLRGQGFALTADGIFGSITKTKVQAFQTAKGLSADGIVGPKTWKSLISGIIVKSGLSGDAVLAVQHLINKFGYNLTVDGVFGAKTNQAVKDFQTKYGLLVDGIVGPETWRALVALP